MPVALSVDRLRRTLLLAAPTVLLGGCASRTGLEEPARALNERLAANDERSFLELFAATEGAQATGRRMFAALSPGPTTIEAGTSGRLRVTWGLPGEPSVVSEADLQLQGGRVAHLSARSSGTEWLDEPLGVHSDEVLVVASGVPSHLRRWSRAAQSALEALAAVTPPGHDWAKPVVVLIPNDLIGFAAYAGRGANRTAAVTVVPGLPHSESVRVVVNPTARQKTEDDIALLTHEAVHAGMRSPRLTGAPAWLIEGIAEAFTALAHPQVARANKKRVRKALAGGAPERLPEVGAGTATEYALAQVAVQAAVAQVGWPAVLAEAEARHNGRPAIADQHLLTWFLDAPGRLR